MLLTSESMKSQEGAVRSSELFSASNGTQFWRCLALLVRSSLAQTDIRKNNDAKTQNALAQALCCFFKASAAENQGEETELEKDNATRTSNFADQAPV